MRHEDKVEHELDVLKQIYLLIKNLSLASRGRVLDYLGEIDAGPGYEPAEDSVGP